MENFIDGLNQCVFADVKGGKDDAESPILLPGQAMEPNATNTFLNDRLAEQAKAEAFQAMRNEAMGIKTDKKNPEDESTLSAPKIPGIQ